MSEYLSYHPLRQVHAGMKQRCYNPNAREYRWYGARGIKVCERWKNSFANFIADMGDRPEGCSLDRINNDGDYEPSNCRWATRFQQGENMSNNHKVEIAGELHSISEWSRITGVNKITIFARIARGWDVVSAVMEAPRYHPGKAFLALVNGQPPQSGVAPVVPMQAQ